LLYTNNEDQPEEAYRDKDLYWLTIKAKTLHLYIHSTHTHTHTSNIMVVFSDPWVELHRAGEESTIIVSLNKFGRM